MKHPIYIALYKAFYFYTHILPLQYLYKMPIDQKRINGPEASVPYSIYIHSEVKDEGIQSNAPKRHDDRSNNELRNICKVM